MINFLRWLFGYPVTRSVTGPIRQPNQTKLASEMDEGDYHSGPHGYSPNTAYPETQYGSGFDEEAEWADGEH